jgi:hypothetical protein
MYKIFNIHNLVKVKISNSVSENVYSQIKFQIGYFEVNDDDFECKYNIEVRPYSDKAPEDFNVGPIFHDYFFKPKKILNQKKKKFSVESVNGGFIIYTDHPILINIYIQMLLYRDGYTFVHAAAVTNQNNEVILFPGAGGVGKTALLGELFKSKGYRILGDDLILINRNGQCLSFPRDFVLKDYHKDVYPEIFNKPGNTMGFGNKIKHLLKNIIKALPFFESTKRMLKKKSLYAKVLSFFPLPNEYLTVPVKDIFGESAIIDHGNLSKIIFLERTGGQNFKFDEIEEDSLTNRIFSIIHREWEEYLSELVVMGCTEQIDLCDYAVRVVDNIKVFVRDKPIKIMSIPATASPDQLINYYDEQD